MSDTELLALTALVNSQAAHLAYRTAKAQSMNEEPTSGDYNEYYVRVLAEELIKRGAIE